MVAQSRRLTLTAIRTAALRGIFLLVCLPSLSLLGQVSPGPLSKAHESIDSPIKCASCHSFGAGSPKLHCETCHREIRDLVAQHRGYHGRVFDRAKGDLDCARCHTEHLGQNFRIIRWPTSKDDFDHRETGYALEGRHAGLRCEQCHNPSHISSEARARIAVKDLSRTFEGLAPQCLTCHEDRHAGQLGADCQRCHDPSRWKPVVSFDHSGTRFPLTGRHQDVACARCHPPLASNAKVTQYTGLKFAECSGCHRDPHQGAFAARCERCHNSGGWREVRLSDAFDHGKTQFPLEGKHAALACEKCHKDANFKTPVAHAKCMDCHQDQHRGQFQSRADHGECGACHTADGFRPATFTEARHAASAFPLTAKHAGVACAKCHPPAGLDTNYHPAFQACAECHRDPHGGQFADAPQAGRCEDCHTVDGFQPSTFSPARHQSSAFPLKGAHAATACEDCHRKGAAAGRTYHFANRTCEGCHQDPHQGQFPTALRSSIEKGRSLCEGCHGLNSWQQLKQFDHAGTGYQLAGAHRVLACVDCHHRESQDTGVRQVPFKTAPDRCVGCHEDIHAGQFQRSGAPADCSRCHDSTRWTASLFDHDKGTGFSLSGAHANVPCRLCHVQRAQVNGRVVVEYHNTPDKCSSCHR